MYFERTIPKLVTSCVVACFIMLPVVAHFDLDWWLIFAPLAIPFVFAYLGFIVYSIAKALGK